MNKIETVEAAAEVVGRSSISVDPKRCSYVRNWNSTCRMCLDVCQHEAIERSIGHIAIKPEKCTECGACVAACPTSTFGTTAPTMNQIVQSAQEEAEHFSNYAVFACQRQIEKLNIDVKHVTPLPCLNYLDEYIITGLFATNVKAVILFRGDCEGCDIDCSEPYFDTMVRNTKMLLKLWKIDRHVKVYKEIPEKFILSSRKKQHTKITTDKREAFQNAGQAAKGYAFEALGDIVADVTGDKSLKKKHVDPKKQIVVRLDEVYPPDTYRGVRMLRMLDYLGERPYGTTFRSRFWTEVDIDPERCRHCGCCATMCVTRALRFEESHDKKTVTLTFEPSLCVGCRLCKDACLTKSMKYTHEVLADDLDADVVKYLLDGAPAEKRKKYF